MGKTALATNIAFNAAQKLQDNRKNLQLHFFLWKCLQNNYQQDCRQSRIKSNDIRRGKISNEQFDKFIELQRISLSYPYILMKRLQLVSQQ